jgi:hypothetical protein
MEFGLDKRVRTFGDEKLSAKEWGKKGHIKYDCKK